MHFKHAFKYLPEPDYTQYSRLFFLHHPLGWVHHTYLPTLKSRPDIFNITQKASDNVNFSADFIALTFQERTARFATFSQQLKEANIITNWRDEAYGVYLESSPLQKPLFSIERGAAPLFGIMVFGTHINGYISTENGEDSSKPNKKLWIARRSKQKKVEPHKLDQIAAGGLSFGMDIVENARREAIEEANIPEILTQNIQYAGALHNIIEENNFIRQEYLFSFDLELPNSFTPEINDGEVEAFSLFSPDEVARFIASGEYFKPNSGLITLQFLLRHNLLNRLTKEEEAFLKARLFA